MASSYGHIGVLFTTRGTLDAAVSWNLRSLLIRAELRSLEIRTNLRWLTLPKAYRDAVALDTGALIIVLQEESRGSC
jgi:hypothetical protein